MNIKKYITSFVFVIIFILGIAFSPTEASAENIDLSGNAWSGNVGWISFNCFDSNKCGTSNYKVTWDSSTGSISGYAWNENIGWIHFNSGLSSCPNGNTTAICAPGVATASGLSRLKGYARAVGGSGGVNFSDDTWSGFIDLSGVSVGAVSNPPTPRQISGYAWGSDVIGWIDMSGVQINSSSNSKDMKISLSANKYVVPDDQNPIILYFSHSIDSQNSIAPTSCTSSKTVNGVVQPAQGGWGGPIALRSDEGVSNFYPYVGYYDAVYTVVCSNGSNTKTASVEIKVLPNVQFNADRNHVSYVVDSSKLPNPVDINSVNAVRFSWSARSATSCTISNTGDDPNSPVSVWSGPSTNSFVEGFKDFYVGQYSNTYSMTCVNANNGLSTTVSRDIKVFNFMDNISPDPASVSYPSPNSSNISFHTHYRNVSYNTNGIGNIGPNTPNSFVTMDSPNSPRIFYQSFIAHDTGPLMKIDLYYKSSTVGYKPYDLNITIHNDNNGTPSYSPISNTKWVFPRRNSVWPSNAHTTYNWGSVDPSSNINVVKGTKYWIKFDAPSSQWNHLYLASTPGGDLRNENRTSSYSPASSLYYKIFIKDTATNPFSGNLVACKGSKTVAGVEQPAGDGWVAPEMTANLIEGRYNYYKTFSVGSRTAVYKAECFNRILPVETKSSTAVIPVSNSLSSVSITSFTANPVSFITTAGNINFAQNITLSWTSTPDYNSCSIARTSPDYAVIGSNLPASSNLQKVIITETSKYTITCTDGYNFDSEILTVPVTLAQPSITSFKATKYTVSQSDRKSGLYWSTENAYGGCDVYNVTQEGPGKKLNTSRLDHYINKANAYPVTVLGETPEEAQKYQMQCFSSTGAPVLSSSVVTINVTPPLPPVKITFTADPIKVLKDTGTTNLSWNVENATSCIASKTGGSGGQSWSGVVNVIGGSNSNRVGSTNATFRLSCSNADPVPPVVKDLPVEVVDATSLYEVDLDFKAVPSKVSSSENNTELQWTVKYANLCVASKIAGDPDSIWSGSVASSDGSHTKQVQVGTIDSTYRLECSNNISTKKIDIMVSVDPLKKIRVIER